jgi:hypothetical protein
MEIINTGNLKRIGHENTEDVKVNKLFQGVFGVGGFYVYSLILMCHAHHISYGASRGKDSVYVV